MSGRTITNVLLAVIAAVLLFGRDAVSSGIQGAALVGFAVVVIFLSLWLVTAFAGWVYGNMKEAYEETHEQSGFDYIYAMFGICFFPLLISMLLYIGYLWVIGTQNPFDTAAENVVDSGAWLILPAALVVIIVYSFWRSRKRSSQSITERSTRPSTVANPERDPF